MQKVTLSFPTPDSLWLFSDRSKAINVAITPKGNTISGLFSSHEVDLAVKEFSAVQIMNSSTSTASSFIKNTQTKTAKPSFGSRVSRLLSLMNL